MFRIQWAKDRKGRTNLSIFVPAECFRFLFFSLLSLLSSLSVLLGSYICCRCSIATRKHLHQIQVSDYFFLYTLETSSQCYMRICLISFKNENYGKLTNLATISYNILSHQTKTWGLAECLRISIFHTMTGDREWKNKHRVIMTDPHAPSNKKISKEQYLKKPSIILFHYYGICFSVLSCYDY